MLITSGGAGGNTDYIQYSMPCMTFFEIISSLFNYQSVLPQGNLAMKDFDIQKEAGGSLRAVVKDFSARVTENHLEIHLFWAGKGTCCVPGPGIYGPSIAAISVTPGGMSLGSLISDRNTGVYFDSYIFHFNRFHSYCK